MLIKQFATKYRVTNDTVRFYEKEGLLAPERLENGYRLYNETCEKNIRFILVLKQLGFSLQEIKELMTLEKQPVSADCNTKSATLFNEKILYLENKIKFFSTAIQVLQVSHDLMAQEKYMENKHKIELLIQKMYLNLEGGDEQHE